MTWDKMSERERDALVAEKIFGAVLDEDKCSIDPVEEGCWIEIPHYTTDIYSAWEVVEKMMSENFTACINYLDEIALVNPNGWHCNFTRDFRESEIYESFGNKTAPEAICKASLKACGVNLEDI